MRRKRRASLRRSASSRWTLLLRRGSVRRLFRPLAACGRMALTNYLGAAGAFGAAGVEVGTPARGLLLCLALYASQIPSSVWWLSRYRMGPLEWVWRALTYGEMPPCARTRREPPARGRPREVSQANRRRSVDATAPGTSREPSSRRIGLRQTTISMERGSRLRRPEDYEGDPLGQRIGRAEKLFTNGDGDPKHVRVRLGFFGKSVLIPAGNIKADHERRTIVLGSPASGGSC